MLTSHPELSPGMSLADASLALLRGAVMIAGLLVPGAAILRALRLPLSFSGAYLGSAVTLYLTVVLCSMTHVRLSAATLALSLTTVSIIAVILARSQPPVAATPDDELGCFSLFSGLGAWLPLYLVFWAVIVWRLSTQPLTGADLDFRWNWLASQMLNFGSLDSYPPRNALDFTRFIWVESIPPGVASLRAWSWAATGQTAERWANLEVLVQAIALHDAIKRLALAWGGRAAARAAVLIAAALPLLSWAAIMGQETGLTSLSLCAMFWGIVRWRQTQLSSWLIFAALAGVAGTSAREYGLIFPLLGIAALLFLRAPRREVLTFAIVALLLGLLWPLRVWSLTGNPVYSLECGPIFPVNGRFVSWAASISAGSGSLFRSWDDWIQLGRYLVLFAPLALVCAMAVFVIWFRERTSAPVPTRLTTLGLVALIALWIISIPYTGGGLFYSMRVLAPAFALLSAFGGFVMSQGSRRVVSIGSALMVVALLLTLPSTLTLPINPFRIAAADWPNAARRFVDGSRKADAKLAAELATLPSHEKILSECVSLPRSLAPAGIEVVPLWSPDADYLFDRATSDVEAAARWKAIGMRYLVMTRSPTQLAWLARHAVWREPLFHVRQLWQSEVYVLFEITASPEPSSAPEKS